MKFVKLAIVSAVMAAFSVPVLADDPVNTALIKNTTAINNDISVSGAVKLTGAVVVGSEVGAVTDNTQTSAGNLVITLGGANTATINKSGNGVTGNVGVNVASGTGNAQGNEVALAALTDALSVFASAQTFSTQSSTFNANIAVKTNNTTSLTDSFNGVSGNVGVNGVSGSGNMQDNQMAASTHTVTATPSGGASNGSVVKATGSNQQLVAITFNGNKDFDLTNSATISNSLSGMGNIGANMAAGYGNLQHNSLAIASTK